MSDTSNDESAVELVRTKVRGSRFVHYMVDGHSLTLCARVAEYRWRHMPLASYCRRCVVEASRRGWTARP